MTTTAKIRCTVKAETHTGGALLSFQPDYQDGRNKAWSDATPSLSLSMTVSKDAAAHFEQGQTYTLTFEESDAYETDAIAQGQLPDGCVGEHSPARKGCSAAPATV